MEESEQIDGTLLAQSAKREGVFTVEGRRLVESSRNAVNPEIERVMRYGFDRKDAERMIVLNCSRRVDQSKTFLNNYDLSNIFTAVALSVIIQSENPDRAGQVLYERRGTGSDNYYDIMNITADEKKKSINIPTPLIDSQFIRTLAEKRKLVNYAPDFSHDRWFSDSRAEMENAAELIGEVIIEMSSTVDIKSVLESVYGKQSELLNSWEEISCAIEKVKLGEMSKREFYLSLDVDREHGETDQEEEYDDYADREALYTASFITDKESLLKKFPPIHENVYATHSTIAFMPETDLDGIEVGKIEKMKIIGRVSDKYGDALLVENPKSANAHPHITLSCADGVEPQYSNQMIEEAAEKGEITYFKQPYKEIEVVEGYFSMDNEEITS
jgi:hypothetical protein